MNASAAHASLDLSGTWRLESDDGRVSAAIALPGDVHSALIAAGIIPDPYVGKNELDARWVADVDWRLTRVFDHPGPGTAAWYLDIDGIDTVAEVTLNGTRCCGSQNAFRRYRPDVTGALQPGKNAISILIRSATKAANELQRRQPFPIPYAAQNSPIPQRQHAAQAGLPFRLGLEPGDRPARRLRHHRAEADAASAHRICRRSRSTITSTVRSTSR